MPATVQDADLILLPEWLFTAQPSPEHPYGQCLENPGIAIKDGKIAAIGPAPDIKQQWSSTQTETHAGKILLPGFVNAHCHAAMTLLRGVANDLPLMDWLEGFIWPAETKHVSAEFVYDGSLLAAAEMIRSGTTCFNDMYFFPEATIDAALAAGIRVCAGIIAIDFPSAYAQTPQQYLDQGLATYNKHQHNPLVKMMLAPHAPYTVSDELFKKIALLSQQHHMPVHVHLHETEFEVSSALEQNQARPFARLAALGLLGNNTLAVHMTQLSDAEISECSRLGLHVVHCPESNMKLASGTCATHALSQAGVNVCLGTDGAASNNDLDMLSELRSASLLAKLSSQDATAISAAQCLQMATYNGAKALGWQHITGSLQVGKSADMQLIDLNQIETQPCYDPVAQIVYSASREQITDVWCQGRELMRQRQLTGLDQNKLLANAKAWHEKISA